MKKQIDNFIIWHPVGSLVILAVGAGGLSGVLCGLSGVLCGLAINGISYVVALFVSIIFSYRIGSLFANYRYKLMKEFENENNL